MSTWQLLKKPIVKLILIAAGVGAIYLAVRFATEIKDFLLSSWAFLSANSETVVSGVIGGVFASLIAGIIAVLVFRRSERAWHETLLRKYRDLVADYRKLIASDTVIDSYRKQVDSHNEVLVRLRKALVGRFTKSLLEYYPRTSQKIAEILSKIAQELYSRHYERVIVTHAKDSYRLASAEEISLDGKAYHVWRLALHIRWRWLNDTQQSLFPLRTLRFIVAAPASALESFLSEQDRLSREEERKDMKTRLKDLRARANYVWSTVVHPAGGAMRVRKEDLKLLYSISRVEIQKQGQPPMTLGPADLALVPEMDFKDTIYAGYRLRQKHVDERLDVNEWMVVEYSGHIVIPLNEDGDCYSGSLAFPPSDLIGQEYVLNLVYPEALDVRGRAARVASVLPLCGCSYLYDKLEYVRPTTDPDPTSFPNGFAPKAGERAVQIQIKEPLSDLHIIQVAWKAETNRADTSHGEV